MSRFRDIMTQHRKIGWSRESDTQLTNLGHNLVVLVGNRAGRHFKNEVCEVYPVKLRDALAISYLQPVTDRDIPSIRAIRGNAIYHTGDFSDSYQLYQVTQYDKEMLVELAQPTINKYRLLVTGKSNPKGNFYYTDNLDEIESLLILEYMVPIDTGWQHRPGPWRQHG